jgi:hypothetical protein
VISVDGISVVDGEGADLNSRGYIVAGYSSLEVQGWRKSLTEVAKFVFETKADSYAGKTAGAKNCGVIGAKVFSEIPAAPVVVPHVFHHYHHDPPIFGRPHWMVWDGHTATPTYTCSTTDSGLANPIADSSVLRSCSMSMANLSAGPAEEKSAEFNLGAGWGSEVVDRVAEADFERLAVVATLEIYFSDEAGLTKAGIQLGKRPSVSSAMPQAFGGFCKPPA